jgi:hypothetical protein
VFGIEFLLDAPSRAAHSYKASGKRKRGNLASYTIMTPVNWQSKITAGEEKGSPCRRGLPSIFEVGDHTVAVT